MSGALFIPDPHEPFGHKDGPKFARKIYDEQGCDTVIFGGDLLDHHRISRHIPESDALGAVQEYKLAKKRIEVWKKYFPKEDVKKIVWIKGNHCKIPKRQAKEIGLPDIFLKDLKDVYDIPDYWEDYNKRYIYKGVLCLHEVSGQFGAYNKSLKMSMSVAGCHVHSKGGVVYWSNPMSLNFGLTGGCLIDKKWYAFRYADTEPVLGVGVIKGPSEAYWFPMNLGRNKKLNSY